MPEKTPATTDGPSPWLFALVVAFLQNAIAVYAVYASSQDILSDAACIGGIFGSLANLAIIAVVALWSSILAVKSYRNRRWAPGLKPLLVVALSSGLAVVIGMNAALRCTV